MPANCVIPLPQPPGRKAANDGASTFPAREKRERISVHAIMLGEYTPESVIIIRNISQFGIGATTEGALPDIGENLSITLATGDSLHGQVRWVDGSSFGLRLHAAFDINRLEAINRLRLRLLDQAGEATDAGTET